MTRKKNKNIYKIKNERKTSQMKIEEYDDIFQASINRSTKFDKNQLIEENASVSSLTAASTFNGEISSLGKRNKKSENILEFGGFNKIKTIDTISILIGLILLLIEYIILDNFQKNNYNYTKSLFEYSQFNKLYFQFFSSVLTVVKIGKEDHYIKIIDPFVYEYTHKNNQESFDDYSLIICQNIIISQLMMQNRNYLVNIHKSIGSEKYNELFNKVINFSKVTQKIVNKKYYYNITQVNIQFSEAILSACNSFQNLAMDSNETILLLNGKDNPFGQILHNSDGDNYYLNDYQKEMYEMILNYKNYYKEFNNINGKLLDIIGSKTESIRSFVYINLTFNILLILFIGSLMYIYTITFESITIKIINYINMIINVKNDDCNFSEIFLEKIENLENILQFYNIDPIKSVQDLNVIYTQYQQQITNKNKNNALDSNKKNYKKIVDENKKNELDDIPKNQRIISKKELKSLGLTYIYKLMYYINSLLVLILYVLLIFMWTDYFTTKNSLFNLKKKNSSIEMSLYRAINCYHLMVFYNLSIDEVTEFVISNETERNKPNALILDFYENLKLAFNSKKEKNKLGKIYQDLDDVSEFNCESIYDLNSEFIKKIDNNTQAHNISNIKNHYIQICETSKIIESKDFRTILERHFQYIRNGMQSIKDFTYIGLNNHIMKDGIISRVSLFFDYVIIFIVEIAYAIPYKDAIDRIDIKLIILIKVTQILFFIYYIIEILLLVLLYIPGINSLCNQIYLLKKVFKLFGMHE